MINQRSRELLTCALLLTFFILASPSFGAENRWSSKGQPGAGVTALVMSRSNASLLYVGAYGGGVFRSLDAGESWQAINAGITDYRIVSLAMDPVVPVRLYAGTDSGRFFSTIDGGENWEEMPAFTEIRIGTIVVAADSTIYALTSSIFRSSDRGAHWSEARNGLDGDVEALSAVPSIPRKLFAGTSAGLFTTTDRGDSWSRVPIPSVAPVRGVAASDDGQTIYVNSGANFHTSIDGGRTWNSVLFDIGVRNSKWMAIDRSSSATAWATTYDCGDYDCGEVTHNVYRTTDTGRTWQRLDFVDEVRALLLDGDTVYAGTSSGVFKITDAAQTWTPRNSGLNVGPVSEVVVDADNPQLMYAATPGGIFKTTDGGKDWARSVDLPDARAVAIDPNNPAVVFASSFASARKTTDGGATWSEVRPNPGKLSGARALAIDPSNPSTVYAVLVADGLSKSIDGGSTFSLINSGLPYNFYYGFYSTALAIDSSAPSNLFASTYSVAKSTNGGGSWEPVTNGFPIYYATALAVDPTQSAFVYAATDQGLFRSSDGGHGWERLQNGLPTPWFTDVVVDPWESTKVYVSTSDSGVFKSSDRGKNWTAFNEGLPIMEIHSLAIDSTGTFLAAATAGGVFTFSSGDDVITLPPELHAERLASDPLRLPRLLEQVRALSRSSPPTSQDSTSSRVGLVFAAAGNTAGALGTHFHSDVTLMNDRVTPQDVIAVWLAAGSDGTDAPSLRLTLAPSAITVTNFVGKIGFSGLGSLLFIGIDANANLDPAASLTGFSRIWTAGPGGRGSVSQSLPAAHIASLGGNSAAAAIGLRMDPEFRANAGIVNLGSTSHTFLLTLTGERKSATLSVVVEPFSMQQVPLPEGDYGALTALFQVTGGEFPWTAYGSSVDNLTGDGWASQAVPQPQPPTAAGTGQVWGHVQNASGDCIIGAVVEVLDGPLAGARSIQWDVCGPVWDGGAYNFDTLPVNTWVRLRASKEGYRSREMTFYAISGASNPSNFVLERE